MRIALFNLSPLLSSDGPRLIAALLKRAGHKVNSIYLARAEPLLYDNKELELLDPILRECDLVMMGVYSTHAARAAQLTEFIHRKYQGLKVIWGGPHCISAPELSMRHADGVCFSEADEVIVELVKRIEEGTNYLDTPNMAFIINGEIIKNKVLPPFYDLDNLPYSDYNLDDQFLLDKSLSLINKTIFKERISSYPYNIPTLYVLTSRGCPNNCTYCNNCRYTAMFKKNPIRIQSTDRVIEELEYVLKKVDFVQMIGFGDDDFFVRSKETLEDFAQKYKNRIGLPYGIAISANSFNENKLKVLMNTGLKIIQMGVQSGSEKVLANIYNRKIRASKTELVVKKIAPYHKLHALDLLLDFIIDNPYEAKDDIMETQAYLERLPFFVKINIFFLSYFPGTPIYEKAIQDGIIEEFDYQSSFRRYGRSKLKYQKNYETALLLFTVYIKKKYRGYLTKTLLNILKNRITRRIANILPGKIFALIGDFILNKGIRKK